MRSQLRREGKIIELGRGRYLHPVVARSPPNLYSDACTHERPLLQREIVELRRELDPDCCLLLVDGLAFHHISHQDSALRYICDGFA